MYYFKSQTIYIDYIKGIDFSTTYFLFFWYVGTYNNYYVHILSLYLTYLLYLK